uniref:Uncharacterized protein n=1 Tax=Panagrolaimus sp. JU765 TaxID=591449 RepID=A0AC34RSR7_9BILA
MSADMALELKDKNVTVVSLWPGVVKTELANKYMAEKTIKATKHQDVPEEVQEKMFEKGESTEYPGIAIVALASDPNVIKLTGRCLTTADLGDKYGFTDIDGRMIVSMRSLKFVLSAGVVKIPFAETIAAWIPRFIKIPGWLIAATISRL